jgi:release factor glutamine methyltransferase
MINKNNNIREISNIIIDSISKIYPKYECESIAQIILSQFNISKLDVVVNSSKTLEEKDIDTINNQIIRLKNNEPIQYILGYTYFYDLRFDVNQQVLIPRPETEELVDWIVKTYKSKKNINILDIGTGTACIPISLAKNIFDADVSSIDISSKAIETAKINAKRNNVEINFINADILCWQNISELKYYDLIVSNPPYVMESEKIEMQKNVLEYEPEIALFVNDNNPLIFYKTIVELAKNKLKNSGYLFFEINEAFGNEIYNLMKENNFTEIELRKDLQNKNRMIKGRYVHLIN